MSGGFFTLGLCQQYSHYLALFWNSQECRCSLFLLSDGDKTQTDLWTQTEKGRGEGENHPMMASKEVEFKIWFPQKKKKRSDCLCSSYTLWWVWCWGQTVGTFVTKAKTKHVKFYFKDHKLPHRTDRRRALPILFPLHWTCIIYFPKCLVPTTSKGKTLQNNIFYYTNNKIVLPL